MNKLIVALEAKREQARMGGGQTRNDSQHAKGKLTARERVGAELGRKPAGRLGRNEILLWSRPLVAERAADDLFHLAMVKVNAGTKSGHEMAGNVGERPRRAKRNARLGFAQQEPRTRTGRSEERNGTKPTFVESSPTRAPADSIPA